MALNYKGLLIIFILFIASVFYGEEKKVSLFYEKAELAKEEDNLVMMYIFNCIESEKKISDCRFFCDYSFAKLPFEKRVALNKNDAFYIFKYEEKILKLGIYNKKGELLSSSTFNTEMCVSLEDLNLIKEDIYKQIEKDISLVVNDEVTTVQNTVIENKINYSQDRKIEHDYPYASLSLSGVSLHLYYEDLNNFSIFPINFNVAFYPVRYMEIGLFYNLSYKDFYLEKNADGLAPFAQFYGISLGFSFFYKISHYSFGASIYNISAIKEKGDTFEAIESYFLPQFSFYQRLDIKLYKKIYYTMFINFHTTQKYSNKNNQWYGKIFDYDLPLLDVSLLGISVFF